eukprot:scaffold422098_cov41-Prasinocladus_malaysianus.AAC.1
MASAGKGIVTSGKKNLVTGIGDTCSATSFTDFVFAPLLAPCRVCGPLLVVWESWGLAWVATSICKK